jgi:uncharacterized protein (DUF2062 family)
MRLLQASSFRAYIGSVNPLYEWSHSGQFRSLPWTNEFELAERCQVVLTKRLAVKSRGKKTETLRSFARKAYRRFLKIRGRPREIALGFALGLFIGMTPTLGIQTAIALFAASILKWNKISAALGVWITNPLTAPLIYGLTYAVGRMVLGIAGSPELPDEFSVGAFRTFMGKAPGIFGALTAGAVVVGLPVAVMGYHLSYLALQRYQEQIKCRIQLQGKKIAHKIKKVKRRRTRR